MTISGGALLRQLRDTADHEARRVEIPLTGGLNLADLVRLAVRHAQEDALLAFAGNLTYNAFLALFPFLLFLVSVLKAIHGTQFIVYVVNEASRTLPVQARGVVRHQVLPEVVSRLTTNPILSVCLALGSLWAASFVARAIIQAMNRMYGVQDTRPLWQRFVLPLVFSVGAAVLFLAALGVIVFGAALGVGIGGVLGSGSAGWWAWAVLRWPLLVGLAFLAFDLMYSCAPDIEQRASLVSAGAVLATVAWLIFSLGFSLVLNNFAQFLMSPLYGWFTGLIILLMYLYWSSVILLAGAELNRVVEEHDRSVGSGGKPGARAVVR